PERARGPRKYPGTVQEKAACHADTGGYEESAEERQDEFDGKAHEPVHQRRDPTGDQEAALGSVQRAPCEGSRSHALTQATQSRSRASAILRVRGWCDL